MIDYDELMRIIDWAEMEQNDDNTPEENLKIANTALDQLREIIRG